LQQQNKINRMKPTLVILAAGMGSRYGGLKQLDALGPGGETIMDYSVFDSIRAGFGKVVFIIRKDFEDDFRCQVLKKYEGHIPTEVVFQSINDLPEGFKCPEERIKPWGTNHAVLMAKEVINEPFCVINADDFYGRDCFAVMGSFLSSLPEGSKNLSALERQETAINKRLRQAVKDSLTLFHASDLIKWREQKDNNKISILNNTLNQQTDAIMATRKPFKYSPAQIEEYTKKGGNPNLDGFYTVFGEVYEGLEVIEAINSVNVDGHYRPQKDIKIIKAYVLEDEQPVEPENQAGTEPVAN
jgi:hypothetical protein